MRERDFQDQIIQLAELCGWWVYHNARARGNLRSHTSVGFPDLVLVRNQPTGTDHDLMFWEIKTDKGRSTGRQIAWMQAINGAGGVAYEVRPSDWEWIEMILKGETRCDKDT